MSRLLALGALAIAVSPRRPAGAIRQSHAHIVWGRRAACDGEWTIVVLPHRRADERQLAGFVRSGDPQIGRIGHAVWADLSRAFHWTGGPLARVRSRKEIGWARHFDPCGLTSRFARANQPCGC